MPSLPEACRTYGVFAKVVALDVTTNFVVDEKIVLRTCAAWFAVEYWSTEKTFYCFNLIRLKAHILEAVDLTHLFYCNYEII